MRKTLGSHDFSFLCGSSHPSLLPFLPPFLPPYLFAQGRGGCDFVVGLVDFVRELGGLTDEEGKHAQVRRPEGT